MVAGRLTLQTILLLSGVMTHAQTVDPAAGERLEIQTVLGFSNTFRLGRWTPLTVIVTNHDNNLTGEIEVEVTPRRRAGEHGIYHHLPAPSRAHP